MNFAAVYRISFYVMLTLATLSLSIDATDQNPIAMLYPIGVAVAGAIAFVTVDRNPRLGIEQSTANWLALGSLALVYLELRFDENLLILAWTHWLVYLQIIMIFLPKTVRDDWRLFGISLLQVVVGGFISQSDIEGAALLSWAICSLWVLALFTLRREAIRAKMPDGIRWYPPPNDREPYPNLIDTPFVLSAVRVALTTLALGGVIFLAMPRRPTLGSSTSGEAAGKHLTGFDDDVQLGQLGEILENDSVVMTVSLYDKESEERVDPKEELLFRGVSLARYTRGRWRRSPGPNRSLPVQDPSSPPKRIIVQQIRLEPTDNTALFALKPVLTATGSVNPRTGQAPTLGFDALDGSIARAPQNRNQSYDYKVESDARLTEPQAGLEGPDESMRAELTRIGSNEVVQQLRSIALPVVKDIDPSDVAAVAKKLEAHLRDSGQFHYTLAMDVVDPSLDPVVDFLTNRKEGHCEYFASALTLMLRSLGYPARLVNGFKGGDWNALSGTWVVRQKHAHSWVEVLTNPPPKLLRRNQPEPAYRARWLVLDPTPGAEREASVAKVGGAFLSFRQFSDFGRYIWAFYVVGFNAERQRRFLYDPIRELFRQAQTGYQLLWTGFKRAFAWVFNFPSFAALISVRGFLVTFGSLLFLALLFRWLSWLGKKVWRRFRGPDDASSMMATGTLFYRRLVDLLKTYGVERPAHETPREFAARASRKLSELGIEAQSVADVPPQIVEAFYRIRFGLHDLTPEDLSHLESRLDALQAKLQPSNN